MYISDCRTYLCSKKCHPYFFVNNEDEQYGMLHLLPIRTHYFAMRIGDSDVSVLALDADGKPCTLNFVYSLNGDGIITGTKDELVLYAYLAQKTITFI